MFTFDFKSIGVRSLKSKKIEFNKIEKKKIFYKLFINNKRSDLFLFFKFKKYSKKIKSISYQANVCLLTGRHRSIINECGFKRQIFKRSLMENKISFIKKK